MHATFRLTVLVWTSAMISFSVGAPVQAVDHSNHEVASPIQVRSTGGEDLPAPEGVEDVARFFRREGDVDVPAPEGVEDVARFFRRETEVDVPSPEGVEDVARFFRREGDVDVPAPEGVEDVARFFRRKGAKEEWTKWIGSS